MSAQVRFQSVVAVLLSICLACPACTTTRQVPLGTPSPVAQRELVAGRKAVIRLRNGDQVAGTVVSADDTSVTVRSGSGAIRGIAYEDIEALRTSRVALGRTAALIGGVLVGAFGVFVLALLHSEKNED